MKKQLLAAAVAATMTSVAMADVSISGAAQVNWTNTDTTGGDSANTISHDMDLKVTGKSGDTTFVLDIENLDATNNAGLMTKNAYMTTSIAGANIKMGSFYSSDSLLANGTNTADQVSIDYTMNGVKVQYEAVPAAGASNDESVTISGEVAGVAISHEIFQDDDKTDTKISGSFQGVNVAYRTVDADTTNSNKDSLEVSTDIQGVTLTYAEVDVDGTGTTTSDAWFGTFDNDSTNNDVIHEASGFGASTTLAGNKVTVKSYDVKEASTQADDSYTKFIVNRALASGATLEVTYTDKDAGDARADVETLDVELAIKF